MLTRKRLIIGGIVVGLLVGIVVFVVMVLPLLTTKTTASRDVQATRICPNLDIEGTTARCFVIVKDESLVRFSVNEELGGRPTTAVGTTNQIAGEIVIDVDNPSASQLGPIEINLRTLETDELLRNNQIRARILRSGEDEFEFTTFSPTRIEGLPTQVSIGEPFSFMVVGNLPLVGVTHEATFSITVTPESETRIVGRGQATVLRSDYGIQIPNVQGVANVSNEVLLEIEFVAVEIAE